MGISLPAIVINLFVLVSLIASFSKSKEKSLQGLRIAINAYL